jgi:hypothetical protein
MMQAHCNAMLQGRVNENRLSVEGEVSDLVAVIEDMEIM